MSRSEHEMRMLDQNYGRIEDRRQERLINERGLAQRTVGCNGESARGSKRRDRQ